ncbi:hypothetical protein FBEOM_11589 [Fusarium beomiforme]|uniref:Uncharacterized protein n=1 Tax=Fusarium beomiforme TaxID=44412 RepID=A0A9P5A953_9HYPO|nr:hypothetical protein FBEOM_11589 [Fusarium beomiforme]
MSPFVRVRVPELEHQISSHELIIFLDELNEAFLANPALQAANNVANIGGMAPSMIVQMASVGVNVVAGENVFLRQQYNNTFEDTQQVLVNGPVGISESNSHPVMQRMSSLGNRVMSLSFDNVEEATMPDGFWKKWGAKEANKAEQKQNDKMMKDQAKNRRSGRRGGRGTSRRQERQEEKKAKETKKILWIVIAAKEESAGADDDWDSELKSSGPYEH